MGGETGTIHQPSFRSRVIAVLGGLFLARPVFAGGLGLASLGGYGLKIYRAGYSLYPFVQVYFRTFDHKQQLLVNLNVLNIGLMVKERAYDPIYTSRAFGPDLKNLRTRILCFELQDI